MKEPLLNELLTYQNESVVHYFCQQNPNFNIQQSKQLFQDLLGWMWLTAYRKKTQRHTFLFGPLIVLDSIWHTFILHTRNYQEFCETYFEEFFHHDVEPEGLEHQLSEEELSEFLQDCFEFLGEDWVNRHFSEAFI